MLSATPHLVADLNQNITPLGSDPSAFTVVGSIAYFSATDATHGEELWRTDGTEVGTSLVSDINVGAWASSPRYLTNVGGTLFFIADDGKSGAELWKSDGTNVGTVRVADINPGQSGSFRLNASFPTQNIRPYLTAVADTLFFVATDGTHGFELWKSDGSDAGTQMVKDASPNTPFYLDSSAVSNLANLNGVLFFSGRVASEGFELWKSDGTSAGTQTVLDIRPGTGASLPAALTNFGGTLFFTADDGVAGRELWKSDGTAVGTQRVVDLNPGAASSFGSASSSTPFQSTPSTLYFAATNGSSGTELFKTDGTAIGTQLVRDINPGSGSGITLPWRAAASDDGTLYFVANDGSSGSEIWKTDGTTSGTSRISDFATFPNSNVGPNFLAAVRGTVFFAGNDQPHGIELWKIDGVAAPVLVKDILQIPNAGFGSRPQGLTNLNGRLIFSADDGRRGRELWTSDGSEGGTILVSDVRQGTAASAPFPIVADQRSGHEGEAFFVAVDGDNGPQLWKSDGTAAGTGRISQATPGRVVDTAQPPVQAGGLIYYVTRSATGIDYTYEVWATDGTEAGAHLVRAFHDVSFPREFTAYQDMLFFTANDGVHDFQLWKSDGTTAGTVMLTDHGGSGFPSYFSVANGTLFFEFSQIGGPSLWKSNGTAEGTVLLHDFVSPTYASTGPLFEFDGGVIFTADDGVHGREVWTSDGTPEGTNLLRDIQSGSGGDADRYFVVAGQYAYFGADDGVHGHELWRTDGTTQGTIPLKDVAPGPADGIHGIGVNVGGLLFFVGGDGDTFDQIWKTDGSPAGTELVVDVATTVHGNAVLGGLTESSGRLFFLASSLGGQQLWATDGSAGGTTLLAQINPGLRLPVNVQTVNANGQFYVSAEDNTAGLELWRSNGTVAGTGRASDVWRGPNGSAPKYFTMSGDKLYFSADDGVHGAELWVIDFAQAPAGDYDGNGLVDGADLLTWQRALGTSVTPAGSGADGDSSGTVDAGDLDVWRQHLGEGALQPATDLRPPFRPPGATRAGLQAVSARASETARVVDSLFSAGDFTALFAEARSYRPPRRGRIGA